MFSEPAINFVQNLYNAPGLEGELAGAAMLAAGVACYLARVAWIATAYSRREDSESPQARIVQRSQR